jgi:hypothetical protein
METGDGLQGVMEAFHSSSSEPHGGLAEHHLNCRFRDWKLRNQGGAMVDSITHPTLSKV